jgi:DNA polymerase III subunit gamma/tau
MDNEGLSGFAADQGVQPTGRRSEYLVVARRYRPQAFAELVGQEHVARALAAAISTNRVGHAYLFTGARGVGKTSAARILAKCLNCQHGPTPVACDHCDSCLAVASGDDVDVLEIDGASNRGIEEMRELRHNVAIRPSRSRFKIYIIDEVHMLTREAFNALLKTLEEPPEHVKFLFCTTEVEKIPVTILSRCQRFDFAGIQPGSIVGRLRQIVDAEQIEADDAALALLSRRANGSMRDSQSLLEQLLASGGKRITVDDVNQLLGTASDERLTQLAGHLVSRDAASALADFDGAVAAGIDPGQLLDQLLVYLRDLMVAAVGGSSELFLQSDAGVHATLSEHAQELGVQTILAMMQVLDQTIARLRYSTQGRVLAELALVRIAQLADLDEIPALIEQLKGHGGVPVISRPGPGTAARPKTASLTSAAAANRPSDASVPASQEPSKKNGDSVASESAPGAGSQPHAVAALNPAEAPHIWQQTLARLQGIAADYATQADHVAISAPNLLVITFAKKYNSCKAFCEQPEQAQRIEQALAEVTGRTMRINYVLAPESASETAAVVRPVAARDRVREKAKHPLVSRAIELFDARPVRVDDAGP